MKQDQRRICYSVRTNLEIQKKPKKEPRKKKKTDWKLTWLSNIYWVWGGVGV